MAQLVFLDGQQMGTSIALSSQCTVGRLPDNTIVLRDGAVRDRHAIIRYRDGEYRILCVDPKHRFGVNGRDVSEEVLRHGDILQFGHVTLLFSDEGDQLPADYVDTKEWERRRNKPTSAVVQRKSGFADAESVLRSVRQGARAQQQLETLYRTAAAVNSTLSLDALCGAVADIVVDVFKAERVFVLLYDELGDLRVAGQRISERCEIRGFKRVSNSIINEVLDKREGLLTRDAATDARFSAGDSIVGQEIQGAMAVPIAKGDRILGALYYDWMTPTRRYDADDLNLLGGIAAQAALAIENVHSYERQIEHSRKLIHLGETARRISALLSADLIFKEATESAGRIFDATKCSLLIFDAAAGELRLQYSTHIPKAEWPRVRMKPGERHAGRVFTEGLPILGSTSTPDEKYQTGSFLVVPVFSRVDTLRGAAQAIGVLCVTDKRSGRLFDPNDEELLVIFASQVGIAIQNARLFEKATVDTLTRLFTRQFFFARLEEELAEHRAQGAPMCLLMGDLDHFHNVNLAGHQVGDAVLAHAARIMRERVLACGGATGRYGGEEFIAYLPGVTVARGRAVAEEIRVAVDSTPAVAEGRPVPCTISIGMAQLGVDDTIESIVKRADDALLAAKKNGRNRVEASPA
jgi:diguanylate cyclase (GGDEF)-like protein